MTNADSTMVLGFPLNTAALACRLGRVGNVLSCLLDRGVRQEGTAGPCLQTRLASPGPAVLMVAVAQTTT